MSFCWSSTMCSPQTWPEILYFCSIHNRRQPWLQLSPKTLAKQLPEELLPFATCSSELCFRIHCTQAAAYKQRSVCNQHRRLMVNFYTLKLIESWQLPCAAGWLHEGRRRWPSVCYTIPWEWSSVLQAEVLLFYQVLFSCCCLSIW